ncbi:MAG TPA: glycosyltransferase [Kofleriaceae bacterium]|nr:glycosyltransferase [Kofleriaceae bacterium]
MSSPKILVGYPYFRSSAYGNVEQMVLTYQRRLRAAGFDIEGFCLTLEPPGPRLSWPELDRRWKRGDYKLLKMYERLEAKLEGKEVLVNETGINLHPEFVESLQCLTVFQCYDDPESSEDLSKPVAASYDLCFVGNIAEVDTYRSWGAKRAEWRPMGLQPEVYDPTLTKEQILSGERDLDLFMMLDRLAPWRRDRVEKLAAAFPDAHFYGEGWPRGFLPADQQVAYLKRAKVGPNIHNSTGPINYRTFYLPGNGVLQVCDNKSNLAKIYELGKEAAGFDTMEECIDLCRYYLAHDEERRQVAAAGWERCMRDYTEVPIFQRMVATMEEELARKRPRATSDIVARRWEATKLERMIDPFVRGGVTAAKLGKLAIQRALKR